MRLNVYTDGSWSSMFPGRSSGAMVLLNENEEIIGAQRYITEDKRAISSRNVAGELLAASCGLRCAGEYAAAVQKVDAKDVKCEVYLYYDYEGVERWVKPPKWNAKTYISNLYVYMYNKLIEDFPNINVHFVKVKSHTGNVFNEMADIIAKGDVPLACKGKMLREITM